MTALLAAERYCAGNRVLMIWDPPWEWQSFDQAVMGMRRFDFASRNLVSYFPRIRPRGELARFKQGLPACGAIAGMLALHDKRGLWQSGNDYQLKASLTAMCDLTHTQAAILRRLGVNSFLRGRAGQMRLQGNVLLGGSDMGSRHWHSVDRRRLYFFVLNTIEEAAAWAAEHFVHDETSRVFEAQVHVFLRSLHERGALAGDKPEKSFFLKLAPAAGSDSAFSLQFGIALERPGDFASSAIEIDAQRSAMVRMPTAVEAEMLFR
jgi:phage tail sheath protein FI